MELRDIVRKNRYDEVKKELEALETELRDEGYMIEYGTIGKKTTYAMIYDPEHDKEYVGYTFIKDTRYYKEITGKIRALQQALARKEKLEVEE